MTAKLLIASAVTLLAGCAGISPQEAAQKLPHLSDFSVCEGAMLARPEIASMAHQEAQRRGLDCSLYASAVMQKRANQNQAIQNYVNTLQPQQQPMRPQVNCQSYRIGNTVQTSCN